MLRRWWKQGLEWPLFRRGIGHGRRGRRLAPMPADPARIQIIAGCDRDSAGQKLRACKGVKRRFTAGWRRAPSRKPSSRPDRKEACCRRDSCRRRMAPGEARRQGPQPPRMPGRVRRRLRLRRAGPGGVHPRLPRPGSRPPLPTLPAASTPEHVRNLMVEAAKRRSGHISPAGPGRMLRRSRELRHHPRHLADHAAQSPQSNSMAKAFVRIFRRDDARLRPGFPGCPPRISGLVHPPDEVPRTARSEAALSRFTGATSTT